MSNKKDKKFPPVSARLPSLEERLPELQQALQDTAESLRNMSDTDTYLPVWFSLYEVAHRLKGLTTMLDCDRDAAFAFKKLSDTVCQGLRDRHVVRRFVEMAEVLEEIATWKTPIESVEKLASAYDRDVAHDERLQTVPDGVPAVDPEASRRFYEADRLGMKIYKLEAVILLKEIPEWQKTVAESLEDGFLLHFVPTIDAEGGSEVHIDAWVAAHSSKFVSVVEFDLNDTRVTKTKAA